MDEQQTIILNNIQVKQKIRRIAYEIHENNFKANELFIAGVDGQGYILAQQICAELKRISTMAIHLLKVSLDKTRPQLSEVAVDCEINDLSRKTVVLVDDVLNTGRTLSYALKPFLSVDVMKIETAVLVNRSHTLFPVYPKYTGYELPTTMSDHVTVKLGDEGAVYLT